MTECPSCNYRNPSHVSTCMTCGRSLKTVRNNPGAAAVYPVAANLQAGIHRSKMAVFDIDDTLFDASQREINARRAGVGPTTPYTGDRKPSEYPKGKKAFMDFFNSPKQFRIDPIIPGALDHVRTLVRDGYTIAYLTGRPHAYFNATMEHLKEKGFPVFNDGNGQPLLFMKPNKKKKTAEFKYNVMRNLQGKFDIHYFYDDLKENRDMAFKLGVIGVYDLRDRLGVRDNPSLNCGCGQTPCKTYGTRRNVPLGDQGDSSPRYTGETIASILMAQGMPLHPQANRPLKQEFVRRVMHDPNPLPGEAIVLGGPDLRLKEGQMSPKERALRDMGWKIGGAGMGEPHQGDMNLFRAERMRRMGGGDVAKRRGLYVVRDYFGSGQGTDVNQTIHDGFYRRARVAAIQFKPSLVMTNFQRVLRFKDGAWQVQSGDIGKRDGVPRTVFIEGAHAYFEAKPEFDDMGTRIPKNLYPKYSFFYWPMRLPPSYLVDSAPTSQPPRETGMTVSTLEDSLPPGWRGHTRSNPPISAYLRDVDRRYIDEVKPKIKLVSPIVRDKDSRYMGVFEVPVMDKYYNSAVGRYNAKQVGTTRLLFYTRTGTGSSSSRDKDIAKAQKLLRAFRDATDRTEKKKARFELIADSPFIRNVVGGTHGQPWAQDFSSLMWAVMLGQGNGYTEMHSKWYIKPSERELFYKGVPSTTPPFPSRNLEPEFESRFAHRTMFYAGVALAELFSNPQSMWSGRTLTTKDEINSFITNYGGTISNSIAEMKAIFGNPPAGYREAAGCIVQRGSDKKILLLRRSIHETSFHGMYELPGGKLEEGETPKEAALIETKEEAGLDVRIVQTLQPHIDHDMKKVYHGFVGAPKKGAKVKISEEHDEYKWVSIKQALALPSKKLSHHARFLLGAMQAEESIKGTKIVKQPGPDGKNCGNCAHYCSKTNTCHLWSKKKGSKVFVLPDWFCQGYAAMPLPNPLPKPRKKNGRKEPSKKFVDRMMGNTKMRAEFPDAGQRYAVTLRLVEKHYGKAARKKIAPRDNGLFGFGKKKRFDAKGQDSNGLNFSMVGDTTVSNSGPAYREYRARTATTNDFHEVTYAGVHPDWLDVDFGQGPQRYQGPIRRFKVDRIKGQVEVEQGSVPQSQVMSTSERQEKLDALGPKPSAAKDPAGFDRYMRQKMEIKHGSRVNPSDILPIYSGEPKGMTKNLGAIFSEVVIGRNIVKDVGEAVQSIYRGLIGGRTSMAEKRLAMGVASMQKELSDNARKLGGNAVANVKMDYEVIQGTATISIVATADAIKMRSPPKKNPAPSKKLKRAKDKYKKFHGGKEPVSVKTETIDVGDVWYALGPCWSIGYMSPKETGDDEQKYIHHTNEDSKDGNFPMMYATMPENGEPMIVIKGGSMKIGMRDGLAWLID